MKKGRPREVGAAGHTWGVLYTVLLQCTFLTGTQNEGRKRRRPPLRQPPPKRSAKMVCDPPRDLRGSPRQWVTPLRNTGSSPAAEYLVTPMGIREAPLPLPVSGDHLSAAAPCLLELLPRRQVRLLQAQQLQLLAYLLDCSTELGWGRRGVIRRAHHARSRRRRRARGGGAQSGAKKCGRSTRPPPQSESTTLWVP
jgi:hypothetical protein